MTITRLIAIPALSAGILGGALGLAGVAAAAPATHTATTHTTAGGTSHATTTDHTTYAPSVRDMSKSELKRHYRHGDR
jgi:hypothetical protein